MEFKWQTQHSGLPPSMEQTQEPLSPLQKATVEDILEEPTTGDDCKTPLTENTMNVEDNELLISYIKGEPVIGVFDEVRTDAFTLDETRSAALTNTHPMGIGRISQWRTPSGKNLQYSYGHGHWIRAKIDPAMEMAQKHEQGKSTIPLEQLVPETYREYQDVFEKKAAERFPDSRPYGHAIDLKPDFVPRNCKVYPLSPKEQEAMDTFIDENLQKGYIRPSKSPIVTRHASTGPADPVTLRSPPLTADLFPLCLLSLRPLLPRLRCGPLPYSSET